MTDEHQNFAQYNLYAYCWNNPVNMSDENGDWPNRTKIIIGTIATAVAVTIAATTFAPIMPVLIGVAASTVGGAISGYITGGKQGAIDGAATGFMIGGLSAVASTAVSAIKAIKIARQGITIGEYMPKVRAAATLNDTTTYKAMKGYNVIKKVAGEKVANKVSLYHNKVFIKRMKGLGAVIYDNGPHYDKVATSAWYKMKQAVLRGYKNCVKMY